MMSSEKYQEEKWKSRKFAIFCVVLTLGVAIHLMPWVTLTTTMAGFLVTMAAGYGIINIGNKAAIGKFQLGSGMSDSDSASSDSDKGKKGCEECSC